MIDQQLNKSVDPSFGPMVYGANLSINDGSMELNLDLPVVIDVETDEKDNFVGMAMTQDGINIGYYTRLGNDWSERLIFVGHNVKFDLKLLKKWGVNISSRQLVYDTCLASYVQNTTKESHGLKDLAKEYLGMEWPTYRDMVGKGKAKQTLDKQEVSRVAAYCGMDCLATYRLWQHFQKALTPQQKRYLETIELPTARALMDMELQGVNIDVEYLKTLDEKFETQMASLEGAITACWIQAFPIDKLNINSNKQIAQLLQAQGAILPKTPKGNSKVDKQTLQAWKHLPVVPLLLEYSKIEKLRSTYTQALLEKQKDGKIYCDFNQITKTDKGVSVGISTGRLSSSNPNLQNIPMRSEEGKLIRRAFIPEAGKTFIDADFSQIEPRLVAHFSKDPLFIRTYFQGRDIYQELVEGTGRDRQDGKTFMLALLYGAQPKKLASVFKCSEDEAQDIVDMIMKKLPGVRAWIERTKYEAKRKGGVWTLFKRWIPLPKINSLDRYEKMHWERVAVNSVIQGSAAEIMKLGLCKLKEDGFLPVITVHDEFLISGHTIDSDSNNITKQYIKDVLENIVKLDVPLKAEVKVGGNWSEAH